MKVEVIEYIKVRVGEARISAPSYQYLAPGSEIDVENLLYTGDIELDSDQWLKDKLGNYYPVKGTDYFELNQHLLETIHEKTAELDWWQAKYHIDQLWNELENRGGNVKIAIIDTGLAKSHPYIDYSLISGKSILGDEANYWDSEDGHGTQVAGMMIANGKALTGVAHNVQLQIIKYCKSSNDATVEKLIEALGKVDNDVDIINISQAFAPQQIVEKALSIALNKHQDKLIVCGSGNSGTGQIYNWLPAALSESLPHVLSISGFDHKEVNSLIKSSALSVAAPGIDILTLDIWSPEGIYRSSGTSLSAPIISGLLALAISYMRKKGKPVDLIKIKNALLNTAIPQADTTLYGKGVFNPLGFIHQITSLP